MTEVSIEKSSNIILLLLRLPLSVIGKQLDQLVVHSAPHLQHNGVAAQLRNDHVDLIDHLIPLRPEVPIDGKETDTAGDARDIPMDLHLFLQFLVVDVFDYHGSLGTDVVVGAESGGQLVDLAFSLGQVHAGLLDHFLATALLPFNSNVVVGPDQQGQLEILGLLPLRHDE